MFRKMRRIKQLLDDAQSREILQKGTSGVLAVSGDDGYPYAVPMSYVCCGDSLFFHCAKTGHKLDAICRNEKVSFCVIDRDEVIAEAYTTYFRSVIVFGKARIVRDEMEKRAGLERLAARYSPDQKAGRREEIERQLAHVCLLELAIEHMTGKEAIELVRARREGEGSLEKGTE